MLRTHTCGQLRPGDAGSTVTLAGWVHRRRDHGGLVFIDLRDRDGLTQVVFDPQAAPTAFETIHEVGSEWVIAVDGTVRARPAGQENPALDTGEVEVLAQAWRLLNPARTPPFEVARDLEVDEGQRLRYRYLDLRRRRMRDHLVLRHRVTAFVHAYLNARDFLEVETPILIKSTPEGARDFLVPSRLQQGQFYALPQSPQQLKQLLMVAGVDRYYQLARCFRDEDQRADRQLEFSQLDLEMAFVEEEDVMALSEALLIALVQEVTPHLAFRQVPFPRLTYAEALDRYGTDKPDLRFGLELVDLAPAVAASGFRVFADALAGGGQVKGITVPALLSRREIGELEAYARELGAAGLAWLAFEGESVRGSVARFLSAEEVAAVRDRAAAPDAATLLIVAAEPRLVALVLGRLRLELARRLELIPAGELACAWVVDPPLFELNEEEGRWDSVHHPFTAPHPADMARLTADPGAVRARAYDLVGNGNELAGGSIRIHERETQACVFALLGIAEAQAAAQFGHMLEAFEYGAPPHGGIAWGYDRLIMVLAGAPNIREVIAFPKTLSGTDPMTGSPSPVPPESLDVLGIALAAAVPPAAARGLPVPKPEEGETQ
jgi:aspartyl-tRNA synthetase